MKALIEIDMENEAFETPASELARILRNLAGHIENGVLPPIKLRDINGHTVGEFRIDVDG